MARNVKTELNTILNRLQYQLKGIIRKLNINYQYIDSDDLYQEIMLYLWQQNKSGSLQGKNDSYILQGCYYYLKNYIRKHLKPIYKQTDHVYDENLLDRNQQVGKNGPSKNQFLFGQPLDEYLYYEEFNQDLSMKEKTLLHLRMRGLSNREIGKELGISHTMVSRMRQKIQKKFQSSFQ